MDEVQFDEEGIKFKYLSNWKEQNKEMIGPNCIKALVKVVEGNPSTITVYKNDAGSNAEEGGKTLENNTSALINDGNMYVFELMHFKEFPYAYNDYLAIMDSIEFEE